jgi:hypothetical protein
MIRKDEVRSALAALESALVEEFRALQAFAALTRAERRALADGDWRALQAVLPRKEAGQADLARLEAARSAAMGAWAQAAGLDELPGTLAEALPQLEPATGRRLSNLRQGILTLASELRELTRGNQALAASALQRVAAVREFVLDLNPPNEGYQPFRAGAPRSESILTLEQWA